MYKSIALLSLVSFLLIGCGGDDSSEMQAETTAELDDATYDSLIELDVTNTETLADDFMKVRTDFVDANYPELKAEYGVSIEGRFYYTNGDFSIYNFTEYWGNDYIQFSVVTNAHRLVNQVGADDIGEFGGISDFLVNTFPENTAFYFGNFEDSPEYQIVDYQTMILTSGYNRNTYYESTSQLFFATNELEPMPVFAKSMGVGGECEQFNGFQESFVLGENPYRIVVEREENIFDQNCELQHSFNYQKVWLEANLLGMSEGGPSPEAPTFFAMDFMDEGVFSQLPTVFMQLNVGMDDTLYNGSSFRISTTQLGQQKSAFIEVADYFSADYSLIIGCEKEEDGSITLFTRRAGISGDLEVSDVGALAESEQNKEFKELNISLISERQGIYLFTYPDMGNEEYYTIQNAIFEEAEIETEL